MSSIRTIKEQVEDACEQALITLGVARTADVAAELERNGLLSSGWKNEWSIRCGVSAALCYLVASGRAHRVARGLYTPAGERTS